MKSEVVDLGPCKKRISVEIGVEKVKEQYDDVCGEIGRQVQLPGFRRGRVPRTLLESKFGRQIASDVKSKLVDTSFKDVVEERELEPVGEPELDIEKIEFDVEQPLKYEFEVEVKPQFDPPECVGLELGRPATEVTDDDVEAASARIRRRFAEVHPVSEPAKAEDFVTVDAKVIIDGRDAWKDSEMPLGLMDERALGLPFELSSEKLIGATAGQKLTADVELPMNFKVEEYRGKKGQAEIEVKEVKRPRLPELDDELAKKLGEASAADLEKKIREGLAAEKQSESDADLRRQIIDQLIAATDFELPEKLLERAAERDELRRRYRLEQMGVKGDALSADARDEMRTISRQQAERDLRAYLIVEKIAKAQKLEASEQEVDAHFAQAAARRGVDPAALKRHAEERGELEAVKTELQEEKAFKFILEKAKIGDKKPEKKKPAAKKAEKKPEKPAAEKKPAEKKPAAKKPAAKKPAAKKPAAKKPAKKAAPKKKSGSK